MRVALLENEPEIKDQLLILRQREVLICHVNLFLVSR